MGRLLTAFDYKNNGYSSAPLFLSWSYPYYHGDLYSTSNSLLVNSNKGFHNPKVYDYNGVTLRYNMQVTSDMLKHKDTLLSIVLPSTAEDVSYHYCPTGFSLLNTPIGNSGKYLVLNGTYTNNNKMVGVFDANEVYNLSGNVIYKANNGSLTALSTDTFINELGIYNDIIANGYYFMTYSQWLGSIVYVLDYIGDLLGEYTMWSYIPYDTVSDIYATRYLYSYYVGIYGNCLNKGSFFDTSRVSNKIVTTKDSLTHCYDKRLNNNSKALGTRQNFKLGNFIWTGSHDLLALEIVISSLTVPSFTYYLNKTLKTFAALNNTFTRPLLTPGIAFFNTSPKDTGLQTFNISPKVIDKGTINEVVALYRNTPLGAYKFAIGSRHIYSLFYVIPLIGGNKDNKFNPTYKLGSTNNEIHAILHHYGNANTLEDLW